MKRHALSTAALALSLVALPLGLTGCESTSTTADKPAASELAEAVEYEVILTQGYSGVTTKGVTLLDSVDELDALPEELKTMLDAELLDGHSLVIVSLGEQPTGGYTIAVDSVAKMGDKLIVAYTPSQPAEDATTTQAITTPVAVIKVHATGLSEATGVAN